MSKTTAKKRAGRGAGTRKAASVKAPAKGRAAPTSKLGTKKISKATAKSVNQPKKKKLPITAAKTGVKQAVRPAPAKPGKGAVVAKGKAAVKVVPPKPDKAAKKPATKPAKAPPKPAAKPVLKLVAKPTPVPVPVAKPVVAAVKPPAGPEMTFSPDEHVVYPTHGVGKIVGIETQEIAGMKLRLLVVQFEKERMTLRVPLVKARESGLRRLSSRKDMQTALAALRGRSRVKRTMWSRRAQEYEAKINSGDPRSIAEVVRDLHRGAGQPDQSFSERQMYQAAMDRLVREFAAVEHISEQTATEQLEIMLKAA
ncbi:MAG: CarD family transcriptional regulator [Rhodospirillaceae bacterium]|nr:CarD family transcriptional regulator [Rhodospirillaceae bacterium]